jgi:putative transposase
MGKSNVIDIKNPVQDCLTEFLRTSAQKMLQIAIEQEVTEFVEGYKATRLNDGRSRIVRNGYLPERSIQTGIGNVDVKVPRVRDRLMSSDNSSSNNKVEFRLSWIPKYMRRSSTIDSLLPLLYLKGISTNDFGIVLEPILGKDAANLSPSVISRMQSSWFDEYLQYQKQDLSLKHYVYWWVDGIYLEARMGTEKSCILVIIGANEDGKKELVGLVDGFRESKESWLSLLRDIQSRGLSIGPKLSIGDGSLGFWGALAEVYTKTQWQRCWVHKTRNVLNKLPKALQSKAKSDLHQIYLSDTKRNADKAYQKFIDTYGTKYPKASHCLEKDKEALLNFYDFPAEHWQSIRTTNPIESTFATVRHRTTRSKGCFSRDTIIASVYKLIKEAEKRWKKLYGHHRLADVINLVQFVDGVAVDNATTDQQVDAA